MKAITLTQPWATLVAIRAKRWETRSWSTRYRGEIAIHAGTGGISARELDSYLHRPYFEDALRDAGYHSGDIIPRGAVLAVGYLADVARVESAFVEHLSPTEIAFGNFTPGRFAWKIERVEPLQFPLPAKGRLGIWEWLSKLHPDTLL